jgi:subtilisin family serine protease
LNTLKTLLPLVVAANIVALTGCAAPAVQTGLTANSDASYGASAATLAKRFVVGFKAMPNAAAIAGIEKAASVSQVKAINKVAMVVFESKGDAKAARQALMAQPGVSFVESELLPPLEPYKAVTVNVRPRQDGSKVDPLRKDQWGLDTMGVPKVLAEAGDSLKPVTVALIDTGVDLKHPDLQGVLVEGANFDQPGTPPQDGAGHGTMTAGCIAAVANNGQGVAGVAPNAKIMPIKVGNSASSVVEAMMWAADHGDMISMSLSFKPNMSEYGVAVETTRRAAEYVMSKGVPMVCSMGNTGSSSKNVPSFFAGSEVPNLIAVGATDKNDRVTSFSTYGNWTSVSAPGAGIMTTSMGGGYKAVDGTSFSTPLTAGVVALMLGHGAKKDPAAIKAKLQSTAVEIEGKGYDDKAGFGRVDAYRAVME